MSTMSISTVFASSALLPVEVVGPLIAAAVGRSSTRRRFEPDAMTVARGETVRFVFTNRGQVTHDAFIGDADAQAEHEAEMRERDDDPHGGHGDGDAADAITVDKGDEGELTHTFADAGEVEIGCHQPGHYEAGMKVTVQVD